VQYSSNSSTMQQNLETAIASNPAMVYETVWAGHGVVGGLGTDGGLTKLQMAKITNDAYENQQVYGSMFSDCCGSGDLTQYLRSNEINPEVLKAFFTSSQPGVTGITPDSGGLTYNALSASVDTNSDGVITAGEFADYWKKQHNKDWHVVDRDMPMFAANPEAMKKYLDKWLGYCGVIKPGEDEKYGPVYAYPDVYPLNKDEIAPGSFSRKIDIFNKRNSTKLESELNNMLRMAQMGHLQTFHEEGEKKAHKGQIPKEQDDGKLLSNKDGMIKEVRKDGNEKTIEWVVEEPSAEQAKESISSKLHSYTVPEGKKMQPGMYMKMSVVFDADGNPVRVGKDCHFREQKKTNAEDSGPGSRGGNQGPGGSNGNGGGGQPGGGGQQTPGGGQSSNPGSQNQNQQPNTQQPGKNQAMWSSLCPNQPYAPVCSEQGDTYPNRCVAEVAEQVKVKHEGECTAEDKTRQNLFEELNRLLQEAVQSGVPESLLSSVLRVVSSLITNLFSDTDTTIDPTTI